MNDTSQEIPHVSENDTPPALERASYETLEAQLNEAESKANEYWDKLLRSQAEVENQRRRFERDVSHAHKYGIEKFVEALIPVIDSLEQGMEAAERSESSAALHDGMALTVKMFFDAFARFGVRIINPVNEPFDPTFHEAMTTQPHEAVPPNTVITVLQKGYALHERLVRPARVIVSR